LIQKSAANYVATDSEIGSQRLCHCQFRNRQQNCIAIDSEMGSKKIFRSRFKNLQPSVPLSSGNNYVVAHSKIDSKTVLLLIQKSATKNYVAAD